jgi:hypothetical protein
MVTHDVIKNSHLILHALAFAGGDNGTSGWVYEVNASCAFARRGACVRCGNELQDFGDITREFML